MAAYRELASTTHPKQRQAYCMNREQLYTHTLDHFLAPVDQLRKDPTVTEIMINGPSAVYMERKGKIAKTDCCFGSEEFLLSAVRNMAEYVGRPIGDENLTMDGRLPDGSRIHVIMPPASRGGICVTIRKFREAAFSLEELEQIGSIEPGARQLLTAAVREHKNIVVAGGTGTGKTSLLNALSREIDASERIVVIEESSELKLVQPHTIYLEAKPDATAGSPMISLRELFVNALRMRPDRILIGEVRRGEALEMVQAMLSGHSGALSTIHASSPEAAATRLETLCLLNDAQLPVYVARAQVAAAVDLFVQAKRLGDGTRCITQISSLEGLNAQNNYVWSSIYKRD
jgi:pilus assembly protein CpaF